MPPAPPVRGFFGSGNGWLVIPAPALVSPLTCFPVQSRVARGSRPSHVRARDCGPCRAPRSLWDRVQMPSRRFLVPPRLHRGPPRTRPARRLLTACCVLPCRVQVSRQGSHSAVSRAPCGLAAELVPCTRRPHRPTAGMSACGSVHGRASPSSGAGVWKRHCWLLGAVLTFQRLQTVPRRAAFPVSPGACALLGGSRLCRRCFPSFWCSLLSSALRGRAGALAPFPVALRGVAPQSQ